MLGCRQRDEDLVIADLSESAALRAEHADDPEVEDPGALCGRALTAAAERLAELDRLAGRVEVSEQIRRRGRSEHRDLRVDVEVGRGEELAAIEAPVADDRIVLSYSGDLRVPVLPGRGDLPAAGLLLGLRRRDAVAELLLDRAHVVDRQRLRLRSGPAEPLVGRGLRGHRDEVRTKIEDRVLHALRGAVPDAHHRDHRGDADDDPEHRER